MVKKVLVVDDNPDVIFSVKSGLESFDKNYKIKGVESGMKCLEFLKAEIIKRTDITSVVTKPNFLSIFQYLPLETINNYLFIKLLY